MINRCNTTGTYMYAKSYCKKPTTIANRLLCNTQIGGQESKLIVPKRGGIPVS